LADSDPYLPAWTEPFLPGRRSELVHGSPFRLYDREQAWGGATGAGVTVAVIDSGIDAGHPAVGTVTRSVKVERTGDEFTILEDPDGLDLVGHGTACAGIIRSIAPDVELVSVRVLGPDNKSSGVAFAHALDWVIDQGFQVANLSLSSRSEELHGTFHELVDRAYFAGCLLICSASNTPGQPSYPSLFSSVVSVASHDIPDPWTYFYNPAPPVEFGAWGVNVPVAWQGGAQVTASGNSFAAPHIAALAALIKSKHPQLTTFELKAVLAAVSMTGRPHQADQAPTEAH
jgi:subtilisin family serine protease